MSHQWAMTLTQQLTSLKNRSEQSLNPTNPQSITQIANDYGSILLPICDGNQSFNQSINQSINQSVHKPLVDCLVNGLDYWSSIRGCQAVSLLLIRTINQLIDQSNKQSNHQSNSQSNNQLYGVMFAECGLIQSINGALKVYIKSRKAVIECVRALIAIDESQSINQSINQSNKPSNRSNNQPLSQSINQAITYRRLFDILASPLFRGHRSVLTPTLECLLLCLKRSGSSNRSVKPMTKQASKQTSHQPTEAVMKRLREGIPILMEIGNQSIYQTLKPSTNQSINQSINRPIKPPTRMSRTLILVFERLSYFADLSVNLSANHIAEFCLQSIHQTTNQSINQSINQSSLAAIILLMLNVARNEHARKNMIADLSISQSTNQSTNQSRRALNKAIEERLINQLNSQLIEGKMQLFRHLRELIWLLNFPSNDLSINQPVNQPFNQTNNQANDHSNHHSNSQSIYHRGYNLLDPAYFGDGNDYYVSFESINEHRLINQASKQASNQSNGQDSDDQSAKGSSDESDDQTDEEAYLKEIEEMESNQSHNQSNNQSNHSPSKQATNQVDSYDSESDTEDQNDDQSTNPSIGQTNNQTESKDADDEYDDDTENYSVAEPFDRTTNNQSINHPITRSKSPFTFTNDSIHPMDNQSVNQSDSQSIYEFLPELWNYSSIANQSNDQSIHQSIIEKHKRIIESGDRRSLRYFITDQSTNQTATQPTYQSITQPCRLFDTTMFNPSPDARPLNQSMNQSNSQSNSSTWSNTAPEPLYQLNMLDYLQSINRLYETDRLMEESCNQTNNQTNNPFPRVVYDRNVLGAYQAISGEVIQDPLTFFCPDQSINQTNNQHILSFDSRFEGGNLVRAILLSVKQSNNQTVQHYRLILQSDINTNTHTQWFFFSIKNMINQAINQTGSRTSNQSMSYRFDIVNLEKKASAFNKGMRPCMYVESINQSITQSQHHPATPINQWCRAMNASDIFYFPNHFQKPIRSRHCETPRRPINQTINPTVESNNQPINQLGNQSELVRRLSVAHSRTNSTFIQPNNQSIKPSQHQSSDDGHLDVNALWEKAIKRLNDQSNNQPTNQSLAHSKLRGEGGSIVSSFIASELPMNRSVSQSIHLPNNQPNTMTIQSIDRTKQSFNQLSYPGTPTHQSMNQSISQLSLTRTYSSPIIKAPITNDSDGYHYTLSFTLTFHQSNNQPVDQTNNQSVSQPINQGDTVFLAHHYPYTFTHLRHRLNEWSSRSNDQSNNSPTNQATVQWHDWMTSTMIRQVLCHTTLGNVCELLTITDQSINQSVKPSINQSFTQSTTQSAHIPIEDRPVIIISARVHPGETNASTCLDGLIDWLIDQSNEQSTLLRRICIIKIIPIINVDGVVEGNSRANLTGVDLNRVWTKIDKNMHPTVYAIKRLIDEMTNQMIGSQSTTHQLNGNTSNNSSGKKRKIVLYCDMHGHSTMRSSGLYGCSEDQSSVQSDSQSNNQSPSPPVDHAVDARLFPMLLANRAPQLFDYNECTYHMSSAKSGSARVAVYQSINQLNNQYVHQSNNQSKIPSYTLEASFFGQQTGKSSHLHFNTGHYQMLGQAFGLAMLDFVNPDRSRVEKAIKQIKTELKAKK